MKSTIKNTGIYLLFLFSIAGVAQTKKGESMKEKILFVVTSHDTKGETGEKPDIIWEKFHIRGKYLHRQVMR